MSFEQVLRAAGLHPRDVVADGKWRRCPTEDHPRKKNGAYRLLPNGRGYWRNWATDSGVNFWEDGTATKARRVDPAAEARRRQREREERLHAIDYARRLWAEAKPYAGHPYLQGKGLSAVGCTGLKVWRGGVWIDEDVGKRLDDWLLVPMYWQGRLVNVQRIGADGIKRQVAKAPQTGAVHELKRPGAALTCFCEGLATGLAVFQCVRHAHVVVTFYADNLVPVIDAMRPTGSVVIAADNDWRTKERIGQNPGVEKARNASELIDCGVAYPTGIEGSDWADAMKEWGELSPKRIEREILAKAKYVMGRICK
jgi:putative DNA primase/helicase